MFGYASKILFINLIKGMVKKEYLGKYRLEVIECAVTREKFSLWI